MMFKLLFLTAILALISIFSNVKADNIIYIGGKNYQLSSLSNTKTIIKSDELESSNVYDLGELLRSTPSVEVTSNGGLGQLSSVFFRGTDSNHTLFLLNGVNINDGVTNQASLQFINPQIADQIDLIKGPSSTIFGNAAIGGVINIDTTQITSRDLKGSAKFSYGSKNTKNFFVKKAFLYNQDIFSLSLGAIKSNGIKPKLSSSFDAGYENKTLDMIYVKNLDNGKLTANIFQTQGFAQYDSNGKQKRDFNMQVFSWGLENYKYNNNSLSGKISYFKQYTDESTSNLGADDYAKTYRVKIDLENKKSLDKNKNLVFGLNLSKERVKYDNYGFYSGSFTTKETYLQADVKTDFGKLISGARISHDEFFKSHKTWNLGFSNDLSKNISIGGMISTGYQAPPGTDRFDASYGSKTLKPETSKSKEISVIYIPNKDTNFEVNIFNTNINDLVEYGPAPTYRKRNAGSANIEGVELIGQKKLNNWVISSNILFQNPLKANGNRLLKRAKRKGSVMALYKRGKIEWSTKLLHSGERTDAADAEDDNKMATYSIVNSNFDYELSNRLTFNVKIDNIFDTFYETTDGFSANGRSIFFGLKYIGF